MIRSARFALDDVPSWPDGSEFPSTTEDLERSVRTVTAWGGHPERYRMALSAGLRQAATDGVAVAVPDLAATAAWRSGVPHIRTDALRRIHRSTTDDPHHGRAFAAALLLPDPALLPTFLTAQRDDPFGWPLPLPDAIGQIGGYRGVAGRFISPPDSVATDTDTGRWQIRCADQIWQARADIFGAALSPGDAAGGRAEWSDRLALSPTVDARVFSSSYLVWLLHWNQP